MVGDELMKCRNCIYSESGGVSVLSLPAHLCMARQEGYFGAAKDGGFTLRSTASTTPLNSCSGLLCPISVDVADIVSNVVTTVLASLVLGGPPAFWVWLTRPEYVPEEKKLWPPWLRDFVIPPSPIIDRSAWVIDHQIEDYKALLSRAASGAGIDSDRAKLIFLTKTGDLARSGVADNCLSWVNVALALEAGPCWGPCRRG